MLSFWQKMSGREKGLILCAGLLLGLLVGWGLVLKPLLDYPKTQKRAYERAQENLEILQTGQVSLASFKAVPKTKLSLADAQSKITKSAAEHGLSISRRQPNGDNGLSLWMESVESPKFYQWVEDLTSHYNILLDRASVYRNDDGSVRVQVMFKVEV